VKAINYEAALATIHDHWSPKVVGRVNDQYIKVAKLKGQLVWHKHDDEDELGRRQLFLPLTTFILAGLEPSSLVHHRAV
jgi:hypothetical protein